MIVWAMLGWAGFANGLLLADETAATTQRPSDEIAGFAKSDDGWTELINSEGPVGLKAASDEIAHCGDVHVGEGNKKLIAIDGSGVVAALKNFSFGDNNNLLSAEEFGDCQVQLEFLIARNSNSGVKLQQRYEIQLFDSHDSETPTAKECGGIYPHWVFREQGKGIRYIDAGFPPLLNAARPAGEWQSLSIVFQAPRFDEMGRKKQSARFLSVVLNGETVQQDVEVDSPTGNASTPSTRKVAFL